MDDVIITIDKQFSERIALIKKKQAQKFKF